MFHCATCNTIEFSDHRNRHTHLGHVCRNIGSIIDRDKHNMEASDWLQEINKFMENDTVFLSTKTLEQLLRIQQLVSMLRR